MEDLAELVISKKQKTKYARSNFSEFKMKNEAVETLITEGGEEFYRYFKSTDYSLNPNLIVLSSLHHYYYDSEELKKVKSVVILKKLNRVKEIESFFYSHLNFLPDACNIIGCFVNNIKINRFAIRVGRTRNEKSKMSEKLNLDIVSRFPFLNMLYSIMDSKTNTYMSEAVVTLLLTVHGFKVMNMTETNGLTYFHARRDVSLLQAN